ncbi:MAG: UDP-glucose 4-epimerase GalE [Acutalibacteraceae bacterium]|jgi:UDP-glucose 4-epimerase|nr:UDP-glucose 4-epimerase GalE [Oscillospiraceae bacterium]MCI7529528.1 UDP-glucose 4-epimerase GalE [Oscillospiraceae bacterium]MCI7649335.1 UDP-glucose 4-epimerase GalE [Oscillospiraceae bacterium]MDD6725583.1 UDP-glucose 4-epimerase GalE [Oscillospiraceae bacterium]MDD6983398.1 UDP-glucose 4-epimerase GalE [Oscillospiraceae bacterium]
MSTVLVTGGAGFIGSHTSVELLNAGYDIIILDNFVNSKPESLKRIKELTGKDFKFYQADIRDEEAMTKVFAENKIDAVIHFAGLKSVPQSVKEPLNYYDNNIAGTVCLCRVMDKAGCKKLVFSSSATVYGSKNPSPLREDMPTGGTTNPYGTTKYFIEQILQDLCISDSEWGVSILRYFNPIGAHKSGRIGEDPNGIPGNLMPYITQVAIGKLECLNVCGNDYPTPDGTGVRDYIHVVDLAIGHIKALDRLLKVKGCEVYNLGTGKGYSVLDVVKAFEKASGIKINYRIAPRRAGDVACCYADATKAKEVLGWQAQYDIDDMCADSWRWQSQNPNGLE